MQKVLLENTETLPTFASVTNSSWIETTKLTAMSIQAVIDVNTPAAKTFTAANATEIFTAAANGFPLGLKTQVSNAGGALPTGLTAVTDYFVIPIDANTFYLATSLANALAGTHLSITTDGTGTHTITPTALAGGSIKLQETNDTDLTPADVSVRFIGRGLLNEPTPGNWSANSTENSLPLSIAQGQKIYAQYTGNAATVITSNVTNVDYATKVIDSHGVFSGTIFLAPLTGWYSVNTAILLGGAGSAFDIQYYVNGVGSLSQSNGGASSVGRGVGTGFFLNAGDTLTVRLTVGGTLSNSAVAHWISISGQG